MVGGWRDYFARFVLSAVSSPRVGHSWRTQDGDARQGSKVPDRLAQTGRPWLYATRTAYIYHSHIYNMPSFLSHTYICLHFYREKISAFSSLADSHRIEPTHAARRSQQLNPFYFIFANKVKSPTHLGLEPRTQTQVDFEVNHLNHRGDRHTICFLLFLFVCLFLCLFVGLFVRLFFLFSLFHILRRSCLSYSVSWYGVALPHTYCMNDVKISLWRSFVTTELVSLKD